MERTHLLAQIPKELVGLFSVQLVSRRELNVELLLKLFDHVESLEGRREVDVHDGLVFALAFRVVLNLVAAGDLLDKTAKHALGQVHEIILIGIGHVKFADAELGVVGHVDAFVTEDTTDFEDSVETTNNELLEVQLRGNAEVKVKVESVVVGNEWLSSGTTSNHVHHRGFDL